MASFLANNSFANIDTQIDSVTILTQLEDDVINGTVSNEVIDLFLDQIGIDVNTDSDKRYLLETISSAKKEIESGQRAISDEELFDLLDSNIAVGEPKTLLLLAAAVNFGEITPDR